MTIRDITLGILILLWLYWTYKTLRFTIKEWSTNEEWPFYVGAWWTFCVVIPLAGLLIAGIYYAIEGIINNWNTVVI